MADADNMEAKISAAMRGRASDFKEQVDLLTLEGVRRLLEKDMGLKKCDLDVHKRFIRKCLEECFQSSNEKAVSNEKTVSDEHGEVETKDADDVDKREMKGGEEVEIKDEKNEVSSAEEEKKDDTSKEISQSAKRKREVNEDSVIESVRKRASYFKEHAETITLIKVRRLLEEDLGLEKNSIDSYKSVIAMTLDEVLQNDVSETEDEPAKKKSKKETSGRDRKRKANTKEEVGPAISADSKSSVENESVDEYVSENEDEDEDEEPNTKRKKTESKQKIVSGKTFKNRNKKDKAEESSRQKKKNNLLESDHADEESEENELSKGSSNKRKKEVSDNVYGKRVQHLKSVIKSCGINVPPSVYKRVKQASESERDSCLAMELEHILGREGLSSNPSEKEIKAIKKSKEKAKELEGIDMSNIISNTRRRSASNFFVPPPKPKEPVASYSDEEEEEESEGDDNEDSGSEQSSEDLKNDGDDESD